MNKAGQNHVFSVSSFDWWIIVEKSASVRRQIKHRPAGVRFIRRACAARISSFRCAFFFLSLMYGQDNFLNEHMNAISRKYFQSTSITTALFLAMILSFSFCLFDFFCLFFHLKSTLFTLTTLCKNVEFHLFFSISGLFIYFHAFNFSYICFYWLSPIFFSVLWPDRSLDG